MTCQVCRQPGAGLRYQGMWFCASCWRIARAIGGENVAGYLTERAKIAEDGDAETAGLATVLTAPANPPTPLGLSKRHLGAAVSVDGATDLAQSKTTQGTCATVAAR